MLSVKAQYEDGKLILPEGSIKNMPSGRKSVIVTFLEDEDELSNEFKAELDRRVEAIDNGSSKLVDGEEVFKRLKKKYS